MSDGGHHELIIVRRHEEEEHEHHSSAWKVAHADFMTAMMAFFLIMWLISVTDDEIRKGISQYFNPIRLSSGSTDLKGLNKADEKTAREGRQKGYNDMPMPGQGLNPLQLAAGAGDAQSDTKSLTPEQAAEAIAEAAKAVAKAAEAAKKPAGEGAKGVAAGAGGPQRGVVAPGGANDAGSGENDRAAFQDPFTILARLADEYVTAHPPGGETAASGGQRPDAAVADADRDPFDQTYWQREPAAAVPGAGRGPAPLAAEGPSAVIPREAEAKHKLDPPAAKVESPAPAKPQAAPAPTDAVARANAEAKTIETEIAKSVKAAMTAEPSPELSIRATPEGALISLTDDASYSMFKIGSAVPDPKVVVLMESIARVLSARPGKVVIRGYTDGRPFRSADYDNWRLSAARAHMAHYMLTRGGLDESRVVAIEGRADRDLKNPREPFAAENRRIEILLKAGN